MNKGTKGSRKTSTWFMNTPLAFLEEKIWISLHKKKLHSYFQSAAGSEPTDIQNYEFLGNYALAHAATKLYSYMYNYSWCDSEEFSTTNFKPLAQEGTTSYAKAIDLGL